MNVSPQLQSALAELSRAGAKGLPTLSMVQVASNGKNWNGKKANGDPWSLIKNSEDSYNVMC